MQFTPVKTSQSKRSMDIKKGGEARDKEKIKVEADVEIEGERTHVYDDQATPYKQLGSTLKNKHGDSQRKGNKKK